MLNKNMILIQNLYSNNSTESNLDNLFCPMGIINRNKYCTLPCFFFDTKYCTYWMSSYNQEKAAKEWYEKFIQEYSHEEATIEV